MGTIYIGHEGNSIEFGYDSYSLGKWPFLMCE